MNSTQPRPAAHDDRGEFVAIAGSPYVAYAIHDGPAYLTRVTHDPDGSITLHPMGSAHTRLDLAADAGRWYAERESYAATATHECVALRHSTHPGRRGVGVRRLPHHGRRAQLLPTRP